MLPSTSASATLAIEGMTCDHCRQSVEHSLLETPGVQSATVNLQSNSAQVEYDPAVAGISDLDEAINSAGYSLLPSELQLLIPASASAPTKEALIGTREHTLAIQGMTCASCVQSVENAVMKVPGVVFCEVNLASESASLQFEPYVESITDVIQAVHGAGYKASIQSAETIIPLESLDYGSLKQRLQISALLSIPLLVLAMSHGRLDFMHSVWVQMALATIVVVYGGAPFYRGAWIALKHLRADMNTLIAIGTGSAFLYSLTATLASNPVTPVQVYFETSAAIITLVLLGRLLEARSRQRTTNSIRKLFALQAVTAHIRRNGQEQDVPLQKVVVGDIVLVHPGEKIPVDGKVIEGTGAVDESSLTGESLPVDKKPGSNLVSGSLNKDGFFVFRAESVGKDTVLSRMIAYVQRAQGSKAPAAQLADRISAVFVPIILLVAVLTFAVWFIVSPFDERFQMAITSAVAVLVIACPCALGLATPAALTVGIGRAAECNILIRDGAALEATGKIDTVVFDKTGTITSGKFHLSDIKTFGDLSKEQLLSATAAIESRSEHPLAQPLAATNSGSGLVVKEYRTLPGSGVSAKIHGDSWLIGKPDLLKVQGIDITAANAMLESSFQQGKTIILSAINNLLAGGFALTDTLHPDAINAVKALQARNLRTIMISGDNEASAKAAASQVGITDVLASVQPTEKADAIQRLQKGGSKVAMVGDGINDAPALTQSDLGIAIGAGTDIAIECAGIILVNSTPRDVDRAIELSRRTSRTIQQNYFWAFAYNLLGVPIAAGVLFPWTGLLLSPVLASAAMALSSLSVISNSLRLKRALKTTL